MVCKAVSLAMAVIIMVTVMPKRFWAARYTTGLLVKLTPKGVV